MGRNFRIEAQNLIFEFEKSRLADAIQNAKIVKKWHKENPKPTKKQAAKFQADIWGRIRKYYEADEKRFGRAFLEYILKEDINDFLPVKKGTPRPLSKKQIKILEQRRIDRLVPGIVKLFRSGNVKPLSS